MRLVAGTGLIGHAVTRFASAPSVESAMTQVFAIALGLLLLAGLWTPIAGVLTVILELGNALSQPGDPWVKVLLGTIGMALALIGPGALSVDARRFGWKRIDIRDPKP
jgi:putative oxidoreductase